MGFSQSFNYKGGKYCGKYKQAILINGDKQNNSSSVVIDLENYEGKVSVKLVLSDLKFGFFPDNNCAIQKKERHRNDYFLEVDIANTNIKNKGFDVLDLQNNRRWCVSQKDQCYDRVDLKYVVSQNVKEDTEGVIQVAFLIKNGKEESEGFTIDIKYSIKVAKEKIASPIKEVSKPLGDVISESPIVSKHAKKEDENVAVASGVEKILSEKDSSIVRRPSSEAENQIWIKLYAAYEAENYEQVISYSYMYRSQFDRDAQHMEDAYRFSVLFEEDKEKQNDIYKNYLREFPQGVYISELKKVVKQVPQAKKSGKIDSELSNWKKAVQKNTLLGYQTYLKKYGKTKAKFQKEANAKIAQFSIAETQRIYTDTSHIMEFEISGTEGKEMSIDILKGSDFVIDTIYNQITKKLKVQLQKDKIAILELSIPQSPWKRETIEIDGITPPLKAKWSTNTIEKINTLSNVSQGKAPFVIELINIHDGNIVKKFAYNLPHKSWTIKYDTIKNLETGTYKFRFRDKTKTTAFFSDNFVIEQATYSSYWKYGVFLVIFSIFSGLIFSKFISTEKKTAPQSVENKVEPNFKEASHSSSQNVKDVGNIETVPSAGHVAKSNIRDRIKVHGKRIDAVESQLISQELFSKRVQNYECFDMQDTWENTLVKKIYVNDSCLRELDDFVFKKMQEHRLASGEIPEIGGFLLGCYTKNNDGGYSTALEKFIDVESENNGVYQISFGAKAWSKLELSLESHQKNDFDIMGWFHTHPGHGLFLSSPDLNIYTNFFKAPYQIAMEIDSVKSKRNPSFDVAFFTYKKEGERAVNNAKDLVENWFQWNTIISKFNQDSDVG